MPAHLVLDRARKHILLDEPIPLGDIRARDSKKFVPRESFECCYCRCANQARTEQAMAIKKTPAAKPSKAPKPITEVMNKTSLVNFITENSGVASKDVKAVLASLEVAAIASVSKKGAGEFVLPGLLKVTSVKVPAKPKRRGINPFTKQEQWFAAKPASTKLKVRPLKKLKDAAI